MLMCHTSANNWVYMYRLYGSEWIKPIIQPLGWVDPFFSWGVASSIDDGFPTMPEVLYL